MGYGQQIVKIYDEFYMLETILKRDLGLVVANRPAIVDRVIELLFENDINHYRDKYVHIGNELLKFIGKPNTIMGTDYYSLFKDIGQKIYSSFKKKVVYYHGCHLYELHFYVDKPIIVL